MVKWYHPSPQICVRKCWFVSPKCHYFTRQSPVPLLSVIWRWAEILNAAGDGHFKQMISRLLTLCKRKFPGCWLRSLAKIHFNFGVASLQKHLNYSRLDDFMLFFNLLLPIPNNNLIRPQSPVARFPCRFSMLCKFELHHAILRFLAY